MGLNVEGENVIKPHQIVYVLLQHLVFSFERIEFFAEPLDGKDAKATVVDVTIFDPGPKRGKGTWDNFLKIHAETLWQCDFLSKKTWTLGGLIDMYLLVFVHVGSRRVWISSATAHPDSAWVAQQARNVCMEFTEEKQRPTHLIHDADTKLPHSLKKSSKTRASESKSYWYSMS